MWLEKFFVAAIARKLNGESGLDLLLGEILRERDTKLNPDDPSYRKSIKELQSFSLDRRSSGKRFAVVLRADYERD